METLKIAHHRLDDHRFFITRGNGVWQYSRYEGGEYDEGGQEESASDFHKLSFSSQRGPDLGEMAGLKPALAEV
jgi:hypothetical protein